ncbi:MAG: hypothetical protein JNL22_08100 [Bacteroidales bacterium]|jgi:uncharacterized repeat protein (TIGR03987 family)|nr:hypothetical protein [Bacteroidales bacterium]
MSSILIAGVIIVNLALISYSIGIITEQRKREVNTFVLGFLTAGVVFDIAATICMVIGSSNSFATVHGLIGYSALAVMTLDTILLWKTWLRKRSTTLVSRSLHMYSRYAYLWWVIAYITGALIVSLK